MRTFADVILLSALAAGSCAAQTILGASASRGKVRLEFEMRLEPPGNAAAQFAQSGVVVNSGPFHRFVTYLPARKYLGYDVSVTEVGENSFALQLAPLSLSARQLDLDTPESWTPWPPPRFHAPPVMRLNDRIEFVLMTGPGGQQLIERVTVKSADSELIQRHLTPPRDFRIEDADLSLSSPEIRVNGKDAIPGQSGGAIRGSPMWVYLEGRGRYVFSLVPRPDLGFFKAGETTANEMTFHAGADRIEIRSATRIAPGEGVYNLYLFHDPGFRPGKPEPFLTGAGGTLEGLVRRR